MGYADKATYIQDGHQLLVSGWAAPARPSVFLSNLIVSIDGQEVYRGRMEGVARPDVVQSGLPNAWLANGFKMQFKLPSSISAGTHTIQMAIRQGDGVEFALTNTAEAASVNIDPAISMGLGKRLLLILALTLPVWPFLFSFVHSAKDQNRPGGKPNLFAASLGVSFCLLVGLGSTGSSLQILLNASPFVSHDAQRGWGELRYARADEWQAFTPMAISQTVHEPKFPVRNRLMGEDGQNMLVVGMTGAPVLHVSALAKPATWGFFALDLKRALAWFWWFPFFASFAVLWALLQRVFSTDWRLAALLSLGFTAAPYSVAFSGWPAYTAFFPLLGIWLADLALHARRTAKAAVLGGLVGLSGAGFALVLYPSWQISLAYLLVPFGLAVLHERRATALWSTPQTVALLCAGLVLAVVMGAWWWDAREAIEALRSSVYPGQRSAEVGGDIDRWFQLKGMLAPVTMYQTSSVMSECDAASYVLFLLPGLVSIAIGWLGRRKIDGISLALFASSLLILSFMYFGLSTNIARWSLWSSATSYRMDLALGLAQTMIFARIFSTQANSGHAAPRWLSIVAAATALLYGAYVATALQWIPTGITAQVAPGVFVLIFVGAVVGAFLLLRVQSWAFALLLTGWTLSAALPFNPLGVAPHKLSAQLSKELTGNANTRVAVLGANTAWSQSLIASGVPVTNAVLYHPQVSLWKRLDPHGSNAAIYNRYQNLMFVQRPIDGAMSYLMESPRLDAVTLAMDPMKFDFRQLHASHLILGPRDLAAFTNNPALKPNSSGSTWSVLEVGK